MEVRGDVGAVAQLFGIVSPVKKVSEKKVTEKKAVAKREAVKKEASKKSTPKAKKTK